MTPDEFNEILALGHETSGVEFKGAGPRQGELEGRVIRAILGMSNRRDGGYVVLGVAEDGSGNPTPVGMSDDEIKSWNYDDTSSSPPSSMTAPHQPCVIGAFLAASKADRRVQCKAAQRWPAQPWPLRQGRVHPRRAFDFWR